jgi:hypothetical protein
MPFPPVHKRISFTGSLPDNEIFSFSMADSSALDVEAAAKAAQGPAQTAFSAPEGQCMALAHLHHVVAELVGATGAVEGSWSQPTQDTVGPANGAKWNVLTQALTLETTTQGSHGRHVRGRFYPPAYCDGTGGRATNNIEVANYAQAWANFIHALNQAGLSICVASSTGGGQLAPVTGVSADDIIDTQRRRKNHVLGTRSPIKTV